MTQDEIIEMARQAHRKLVTEIYVGHMKQLDPWTIELLKIFAKLVAAKEREVHEHDMGVLMDALWKACGDDEEVVNATIESQGTLIKARGEQP